MKKQKEVMKNSLQEIKNPWYEYKKRGLGKKISKE